MTSAKYIALSAFLILLVAATYHLTESPGIWYDEGFYTQTATNVALHGREAIQITPDTYVTASQVTVGYPVIYPVALSYRLFGVSVLSGRAVMVGFMLLAGLAAYFLARRLMAPRVAALSFLAVATLPVLYGNGKSVLGEVPGMAYVLISLLVLVQLERTGYRRSALWLLLGVMTGLAAATKPIFILFPIALCMVWLSNFRKIPLTVRSFAYGLVGFLIMVSIWVLTQFGTGDSFTKVIQYYANPYEVTNAWTLLLINAKRYLTESTPLITAVLIGIWGISGYIRLHARRTITVAEQAAFVFCILVMVEYLRLDGWYRYLFPATLLGFLFLSSSVTELWECFGRRVPVAARWRFVPTIAVLLLAVAQGTQLVHGSYVAQYYQAHRTRDVGAYLAQFPQNSFFLYNVPEVAVLLPNQTYYQYLEPHTHNLIGETSLASLAAGIPDVVVVDSATYEKRSGAFLAYRVQGTVNRYTILTRP